MPDGDCRHSLHEIVRPTYSREHQRDDSSNQHSSSWNRRIHAWRQGIICFSGDFRKAAQYRFMYQDIDYRAFMLYGKNEPKFNTEDDDTRRTVITSVLQAAMGADCFSPPSCPTPAETGSTIVTSLSALMAHYPFSVQSGTGPQSITSLLKWQEDMHTALSGLAHLDGYRGQLLQMVEKYQQTVNIPPRDVRESQSKRLPEEEAALKAAKELPLVKHERIVRMLRENASVGLPDFNTLVNQILNYVDRVRPRSQDIEPKAKALKHYRQLIASWRSVIILISVIVTFVCGIVAPMSHQLLPGMSTFQRWLPFPALIGRLAPYTPYVVYIAVPMFGHFATALFAWFMISTTLG